MPNVRKCQACRELKKACLRDAPVWDERNPHTRCQRCKIKDIDCGPDEFKHENDQEDPISGAAGITDLQSVAPAPNLLDKATIEASLREKLHNLSNSENFHLTRQRISLGPLHEKTWETYIVSKDLRDSLENIIKLADLAFASEDISNAEVAYKRVMDWYMALGPEINQLRDKFLMKFGCFYEKIGYDDQAEECYTKIFEDIPKESQDENAPFHHAIRKSDTKDQLSQDALMGIIRCCPPCRFRWRNEIDRQTPLFLAVSTAKEEVAFAILERLRDPRLQSRIDSVHLDATDCRGQTILTTAILSNCSFALIKSLIKYGSKVNTEVWTPDGLGSPLRAASLPGCERIDVARLLIQHHADQRHVCPNSVIKDLIANNGVPASPNILLFPALDPQPDAQNHRSRW